MSKGYLWSLEKGATEARPSGKTLYRIAEALGTTMSDLLGKELLVDDQYEPEVSDSLKAFAKKERLRKEDVAMLARVNFRGRQPDDYDSWDLIWRAVKHSVRTSGR